MRSGRCTPGGSCVHPSLWKLELISSLRGSKCMAPGVIRSRNIKIGRLSEERLYFMRVPVCYQLNPETFTGDMI